jgi:limonene-1,2-epoxide hydrolase
MTINDQRVPLRVAGVFEVDSNGKVVVWRDYGACTEVAVKLEQAVAGTRD